MFILTTAVYSGSYHTHWGCGRWTFPFFFFFPSLEVWIQHHIKSGRRYGCTSTYPSHPSMYIHSYFCMSLNIHWSRVKSTDTHFTRNLFLWTWLNSLPPISEHMFLLENWGTISLCNAMKSGSATYPYVLASVETKPSCVGNKGPVICSNTSGQGDQTSGTTMEHKCHTFKQKFDVTSNYIIQHTCCSHKDWSSHTGFHAGMLSGYVISH